MKIYGIDFTSRPSSRKPLTCLECNLEGDVLRAEALIEWSRFEAFEAALIRPGPWIVGIDFPFGLPRKFIENIGWPTQWANYVEYVRTLGRRGFRGVLDAYRSSRPAGDKEHRRTTDIAAGSISPQKIYGTPVGLMFFEGAPRLRDSGVTIPGLLAGDPARIVVETYPGMLARSIIGRRSYKEDTKSKQTTQQHQARKDLLAEIVDGAAKALYGFNVSVVMDLTADPSGDQLDALLCAIQAASAWRLRTSSFGIPEGTDSVEGWIVGATITKSCS